MPGIWWGVKSRSCMRNQLERRESDPAAHQRWCWTCPRSVVVRGRKRKFSRLPTRVRALRGDHGCAIHQCRSHRVPPSPSQPVVHEDFTSRRVDEGLVVFGERNPFKRTESVPPFAADPQIQLWKPMCAHRPLPGHPRSTRSLRMPPQWWQMIMRSSFRSQSRMGSGGEPSGGNTSIRSLRTPIPSIGHS